MSDEWVPLVDTHGAIVGKARRSQVHGNPELLHPVVHCLVTDAAGALLLQLRSRNKDVQPGRWDTSVGGHVCLGESIESAVVREVREELGAQIGLEQLQFLYRYVMHSSIETELVHTYALRHSGPFALEPGEIDELRFWTAAEIRAALGTSVFTPNFEDEFARFQSVTRPVA